jgi:hypothetical protein
MKDLSRHANHRAQGRSVPAAVIDWLCDFGTSIPAGAGAEKLIFDKAARRSLERHLGGQVYRRIEEVLDAYAVRAGDGRLITVGWRSERVRR